MLIGKDYFGRLGLDEEAQEQDNSPTRLLTYNENDSEVKISPTNIILGEVNSANRRLTETPPFEINTTTYDAFPQLYQLLSGKLVLFHKEGESHTGEGDGVMRISTDQGSTWSEPIVVISEAGKYVGLSGGEVTPSGRIVQFYFIATPTVGTDEIGYIYSDDEGLTWSERITIPMGSNNGGGPTGKMISIAEGRLMQCWFGYDGVYNESGTIYTLYALFSDDNGSTWGDQTVIATGNVDTNTAWTECSFVHIEGGNIVGLVRRDTASYYRQFKSEDNGETWTDQGNAVNVDFFDYQSAPEVNKFTDLDGKTTVVAYWANRSPDLKLRAIYGRDLLNGVSGWDTSTRTDIATLLNDDSGYPSVIHPNGSPYGLGSYYQGKTETDSDLRFFKYPLTEVTLSDAAVWNNKIDGTGTANNIAKFSDSNTLTNSNITDTGLGQLGLWALIPSGIGSARVLNHQAPAGISSQYVLEGNNGAQFLSFLSGQGSDNLPSVFFNNGLRIAFATNKDATGYAEFMRFISNRLLIGSSTDNTLGIVQITGNVTGSLAPTNAAHLTRKDYVDSGLSTKQNTLTFDTTPTAASTKPVTSGGIKTYVDSEISGRIVQYVANGDAAVVPSSDAIYDFVTTAISNSQTQYIDVTGTSASAFAGGKYKANNAALVTITLPSTGSLGQQVFVRGYGTGKWKLQANSGAVIHGNTDTVAGGYLSAQSRYDTVAVEVIALSGSTITEWTIIANRGTLNYDTL